MLERLGYCVLTAGTPAEAIRITEVHSGRIDLVITDVVMPEMNGADLVKSLREIRPSLKCLFSSGYTANVIARRGVLDHGVNFLQKPFSLRELALKVCEVLAKG
jgi:YesN/AraC family two-component response regulator